MYISLTYSKQKRECINYQANEIINSVTLLSFPVGSYLIVHGIYVRINVYQLSSVFYYS